MAQAQAVIEIKSESESDLENAVLGEVQVLCKHSVSASSAMSAELLPVGLRTEPKVGTTAPAVAPSATAPFSASSSALSSMASADLPPAEQVAPTAAKSSSLAPAEPAVEPSRVEAQPKQRLCSPERPHPDFPLVPKPPPGPPPPWRLAEVSAEHSPEKRSAFPSPLSCGGEAHPGLTCGEFSPWRLAKVSAEHEPENYKKPRFFPRPCRHVLPTVACSTHP